MVSFFPEIVYIQLFLAFLALLGGILALVGKKAGGYLALMVGVLWLMGGFIFNAAPQLFPLSAILAWINQIVITFGFDVYIITFEAVFCLLGGIIILAGSKR